MKLPRHTPLARYLSILSFAIVTGLVIPKQLTGSPPSTPSTNGGTNGVEVSVVSKSDLFLVAAETSAPDSSSPQWKKVRVAKLDHRWFTSQWDTLNLNLFDDANYTAQLTKTEKIGSATVYHCTLKGQPAVAFQS